MMRLQDLEKLQDHKTNSKLVKEIGFSADQNQRSRQSMEDKYFICDDILNDGNVSIYGVLDGHGGIHVVEYAKSNIPLYFKNIYKHGCDIKKLFTDLFKQLDIDLSNKIQTATESGSCCCIILVRNESTIIPIKQKKCYVINLGDTRGVLNTQGVASRVSVDHKADNQGEILRVKNAGGIILRGRVSGSLVVTRAIGDLNLKNEGVISIPDVQSFNITEKTNSLIVASDGLWDVCDDQTAVNLIQQIKQKNSLQQAIELKDYGLQNGTQDNISVMVIKF